MSFDFLQKPPRFCQTQADIADSGGPSGKKVAPKYSDDFVRSNTSAVAALCSIASSI